MITWPSGSSGVLSQSVVVMRGCCTAHGSLGKRANCKLAVCFFNDYGSCLHQHVISDKSGWESGSVRVYMNACTHITLWQFIHMYSTLWSSAFLYLLLASFPATESPSHFPLPCLFALQLTGFNHDHSCHGCEAIPGSMGNPYISENNAFRSPSGNPWLSLATRTCRIAPLPSMTTYTCIFKLMTCIQVWLNLRQNKQHLFLM